MLIPQELQLSQVKPRMKATVNEALTLKNPSLMYQKTFHWN